MQKGNKKGPKAAGKEARTVAQQELFPASELEERGRDGRKEGTFLQGSIDEVVFCNEDNGYSVCVLNCMGEPITLVGTMPTVGAGDTVKVRGVWTVHPTYGRQFKVEYFEKEMPTSAEAIFKYLSSGTLKGIGPVLAQRIIEAYGPETLDVIEHHPRWLCDIKGISPKKADAIHDAYEEQFGMRTVVMHFGQVFGTSTAVRIYKRYGNAAIELVERNPYRLCAEIDGIGFERADAYAETLGIEKDAEERIAAGILHLLNAASYQLGYCRLPEEMLVRNAVGLLSVAPETVKRTLSEMTLRKDVFPSKDESTTYYATKELYEAEHLIAKKMLLLASEKPPLPLVGAEARIVGLEKENGIEYADEQKEAIVSAVTKGVTIVTGGPGTGKTTVIKAILQILDELKISCALAAPTGRAAKRMSEASGKEAKTIHRLLEAGYADGKGLRFAKNEDDPLPYKVLIIDETSMVDTLLMSALLRAVKPGTSLVLIGDVDQLPPVGPGNCLNDLIASDRFAVVRLQHIFRQAEQSLIIVNAHRINRGEMPLLNVRNNDFFFLERHGADAIRETVLELCKTRLPARYGIDPMEDLQVVCWTRIGVLGTKELNPALQEALNPADLDKREKKVGNKLFREGDKVMQVRNNYDLVWERDGQEGSGIFNGDIGRILLINKQGEYIKVDFDGRICDYDYSLLEDLELAYAITTHKSQGSEYRMVVIPSFNTVPQMQTRNLLYTAVTRAKELVCMVGDPRLPERMTGNDSRPVRLTELKTLLGG